MGRSKEITGWSEEDRRAFYEQEVFLDRGYGKKYHCLHCGKEINTAEFKIVKQGRFYYVICPNWPDCDGTFMDWFPEPWWKSENA